MHYLIDGYNITKGDAATCGLSLEAQREALITRLAVSGDAMLGRGKKTVVFDGPAEVFSSSSDSPVDIRYSRGETADEVIVRLARSATGPLCVVTSDQALAERVGAVASGPVRHLRREELFEKNRKGSAARSSRRYPASTAGLPPGANKITEELKGIWLEEDEE